MTQAQHTPGPYIRDGRDILAYGGLLLATVYPGLDKHGKTDQATIPEAEATAQLFAAAPDLLAAAEALWNSADELDCMAMPSEWHALCKAIEKARGEA